MFLGCMHVHTYAALVLTTDALESDTVRSKLTQKKVKKKKKDNY